MLRRIGEAIRLYVSNFPLLAGVILTVALPANLVIECLARSVLAPGSWQGDTAGTAVGSLVWPLYAAAVIWAVGEIARGRRPSWPRALWAGLRNWLNLIIVELIAELFILGGLLLLVVPGVLLMTRYTLLWPVAVLEDAGASEARRRSAELTRGRRWRLFAVAGIAFAGIATVGELLKLLVASVDALDCTVVAVAFDCLGDLLTGALLTLLTLLYLDAVGREEAAEAAGAPPAPPAAQQQTPA